MTHETHSKKGVPYDGAAAMRTGWGVKTNPWAGDSWQYRKWLSDWYGEDASCFASHIYSGPAYLAGAPLTFTYRNWRGEVSKRTVRPVRMEYGSTTFHPDPQWLLIAWDEEKQAERSFAVADINHPIPASSPEVGEARFIADAENACPHCGGSGHKDDVSSAALSHSPVEQTPARENMAAQVEWLKARLADMQLPAGKRDHDTREKWLLQCGMPPVEQESGTGAEALTQEQCAKLIDEMLQQPGWANNSRSKLALTVAARAIRRGRQLGSMEKWENIKAFCEENGDD